jgi:hypothetical protein
MYIAVSVRPKQEFSLSDETEYSAAKNHRIFGLAEYSALLFPFGRKSLIYFILTATLVEFGQNLTIFGVCLPGFKHYYMLTNNLADDQNTFRIFGEYDNSSLGFLNFFINFFYFFLKGTILTSGFGGPCRIFGFGRIFG